MRLMVAVCVEAKVEIESARKVEIESAQIDMIDMRGVAGAGAETMMDLKMQKVTIGYMVRYFLCLLYLFCPLVSYSQFLPGVEDF